MKNTTDKWLGIRDDYPTCSGSIEVMNTLVEMAQGETEQDKSTRKSKLVHFGEVEKEDNDTTIHYTKVLNEEV